MNKKGAVGMYAIILALILGLIVMSVAFVFREAFFGDDLGDKEVCRQSVLLRASLPDIKKGDVSLAEFKSDYPLKCKTDVVDIERADVVDIEKAQQKIAEAMSECWYLYGKGDFTAFPSEWFKASTCVPCARIHLTEEAKQYMEADSVEGINIREALDLKMNKEEFRYYNYLENSGEKFSAFNFGNAVPFDLEGDNFNIENIEWAGGFVPRSWKNVVLRNRKGGEFEAKMGSVDISLPKVLKASEGDLLINYGVVTMGESEFGDYVPYLFYFQTGQKVNPFNEVKKKFISNPVHTVWEVFFQAERFSPILFIPDLIFDLWDDDESAMSKISEASVSFCDAWEGIPA